MRPFRFERGAVRQIRIHVLPTSRFKTFAIALFIGTPLTELNVTATALIPHVLRRGNALYPETKAFRERLDDLYGAGFGFDVFKRGDMQVVQFRMDVIHDAFVGGEKRLLAEALEFLGATVCRPAEENGRFITKYVKAEKTTLQNRLRAIVNDKARYAAERCIAEMFAGQPFGLSAYGRSTDLPEMDAASLFAHYSDLLEHAAMDLYVVGNVDPEQVSSLVEKYFCLKKSSPVGYATNPAHAARPQIKKVVEEMAVTQGKLNLGLITGITYGDKLYVPALMYNGILGAYPHSKLFQNVREKASLAYYAASRLDAHKGIMNIFSGIEVRNYKQALQIIREQLAAMEAGEISETEISQTRAMLTNALREICDSAYEMISFDFNNRVAHVERSVPELLDRLAGVTAAAIQQAAQQVRLDTVYFLRDDQKAQGGKNVAETSV
ncbi:MAG TPA: insulinase family protein [Bacilli bacterium]